MFLGGFSRKAKPLRKPVRAPRGRLSSVRLHRSSDLPLGDARATKKKVFELSYG
jgi:hypothetical protein